MEHWQLDHPRHGRLEAFVGSSQEIRRSDAHFPAPEDEGESRWARVPRPPSTGERLRTFLRRDERWAKQDLVLLRRGEVFARLRGLRPAQVAFVASLPKNTLTSNTSATGRPRIDVRVDPLGRHVTDILLREDDEVVAFEPPAQSPAARRHAAMEHSPIKRFAYPLLAGLGKSGWAVAIIVLGPILSRLLRPVRTWLAKVLAQVIPDIAWPTIDMPDLPDVPWPEIPWPDIDLPTVDGPNWTPPDWVVWALDNPKIWVPIMLGIFWGVSATRSAKKSRATKEEWAKRAQYARLADAMREVVAREDDKG